MDTRFRNRLSFCALRLGKRWAACALLVVLGGWAPGARAGMITIDDFSKPDPSDFYVVSTGMNPSKEITEFSSGAIGGQRDTLIHVVGQAKPNSVVGLLGYDTDYAMPALQLATNGIAPTIATLQYSGTDTLNTASSLVNAHALGGGLGVDLTGGGVNDRFLIRIMGLDAQPTAGLDVTITLTSPGGKSSTATAIVPNSLLEFNFYVPFSSLAGNASTSHVDSITFVFNGAQHTPNVDYALNLLGTVPEPTSGTLMVTALGALSVAAYAARRRPRNKR